MNMPNEQAPFTGMPGDRRAPFYYAPGGPLQQPAVIDPNNPPWGVVAGVLIWVASVALLILMSLLFVVPYVLSKGVPPEEMSHFISTDKTSIFLTILSTIPAHLLTLGVIWAVVTRFGKRPFWKAVGWEWGGNVGFWKSAGLAVVLFLAAIAVTYFIKGDATEIDKIAKSSAESRLTLALLAAVTAPLVEELVYRGLLYSALQRAAGVTWAVIIVTLLFAGVHVLEYYNNLGVILMITLLSLALTLLRARTGKLLPCYIVHLIFNGIQSVLILVEPYLPQSAPEVEQKTPAVGMLWRSVRPLLF